MSPETALETQTVPVLRLPLEEPASSAPTTETSETIVLQSRENRMWTGVGEKDYATLLADSIEELGRVMPELEQEEVANMCRLALALANNVYGFATRGLEKSQNAFSETHYHGMAKPEQGAASHIEMVMTNSVMVFATLKLASEDPHVLTNKEKGYFEEYYGENWQETISSLGASDLKQIIGYAAFHETGEWWTRTVAPEKLEAYKKEVAKAINYYFGDSENKVHITDWTCKVGDVSDWKHAYKQSYIKLPANMGTGWIGRKWRETSFDVKLDQRAHKDDTNFGFQLEMDPEKRPLGATDEDKKLIAKTRIVRAADLMQVFDRNYGESIQIEGQRLMRGPAILYHEMEAFMPHALVSYRWDRLGNVGVSPFFLNTIVLEYNDSRLLMSLIDRTRITGSPDYYEKQIAYLEANIKEPASAA